MDPYKQNKNVKNLVSLKNAMNKMMDSLLTNFNFENDLFLTTNAYSIIISNSSISQTQLIESYAKDSFLPYFDYNNCVNQLKQHYSNDKTLLIGQINFNPAFISGLTLGNVNSYAVYGVVYDYENKISLSITECKNLNVYLPDPFYHNITIENLSLLYSIGVNPYNRDDPFYNNRCYQFLDSIKGTDITVNDRRRSYMSKVTLNCLNFDSSTNENLIDCAFNGTTSDGYIICSCESDFSTLMLGRQSYITESTEKSGINLDVMKCPVLLTYYRQPSRNAGMIFGIIILGSVLLSLILVLLMFNSSKLIRLHYSSLYHHDCTSYGNDHQEIPIQKEKPVKINPIEIRHNNNDRIFENPNAKVIKDSSQQKGDKIKTVENQNNEIISEIYTIKDYFNFTKNDKLNRDKRSFFKYFWDQLSNTHVVFQLFFKKSLLISPLFRMLILALHIVLLFLLNAMFYTDNYIQARALNYSEVKYFLFI